MVLGGVAILTMLVSRQGIWGRLEPLLRTSIFVTTRQPSRDSELATASLSKEPIPPTALQAMRRLVAIHQEQGTHSRCGWPVKRRDVPETWVAQACRVNNAPL